MHFNRIFYYKYKSSIVGAEHLLILKLDDFVQHRTLPKMANGWFDWHAIVHRKQRPRGQIQWNSLGWTRELRPKKKDHASKANEKPKDKPHKTDKKEKHKKPKNNKEHKKDSVSGRGMLNCQGWPHAWLTCNALIPWNFGMIYIYVCDIMWLYI